jgi:hypothetical protein
MTKIIIEISDAKDARLLIDFARRVSASVSEPGFLGFWDLPRLI